MTPFPSLRFWQTAAVLVAMLLPQLAGAQDAANQGNLNVGGKRAVFRKVVAVRGKSSGENRIIVLATGQALSADAVRKVKEKDAEGMDGDLDQPYLKAVFLEDGSLQCLVGMGGGSSFLERASAMEGKGTVADGRIRGAVKLIKTGSFAKEVTLNFDVPIDAEIKVAGPAKLDPPVRATVSGKFVGNGKNAAIRFVIVEEHEAFSGKEAITLIFTEKDPATVKKPSFDAMFGKLGSSLILNVHHDGGIFGCQVAHSAHEKQGFTALGQIHMVEFEMAGGNVTGQVSTGGMLDAFGEKWEVDLKFAGPLPAKLRNVPGTAKPANLAPGVTIAGKTGTARKIDENAASEVVEEKPKPAAGPLIAARKLPLPGDATDVQFKKIVEQIQFSSARPVEAVAKEFSANLKQQGWKDGAGSLMGKQNAILKREQGEAMLTIMIQPAPAGSVVKIFTEGLDWSGIVEAAPATSKKPVDAAATIEDAEAQARKALKDALKNLPVGL